MQLPLRIGVNSDDVSGTCSGVALARCPAMTRWLWTVVIAGCATSGDDAASELALSMTAIDAARVLDLANYPGVDQAKLDDVVGLDGRAAAGIAAYRAGDDGKFPSLDDADFSDVAELDAVPFVGDAAFAKLLAYAKTNPAPAAESHEGVAFRGYEAEIVVWGANTVPIGVLNGLLDNRAAQNIVAARPFATLAEVAAVPLIGKTALGAMRGQSRTWWHARANQPSLAGTFDGIAFDEPTASKALALANDHTRDQLVAGGVVATGAAAIVGNRPYGTLAEVAAVAGVGSATMRSLHTFATSLLARGTVPEDGECAETNDCALGLICAGTTVLPVGHCRPEWMAGTFGESVAVTIPDAATPITRTIEVTGLATVPEDLIVHLVIDHPRPQDLRILLFQPSSAESLIWDVDSSGEARVVVGHNLERDSAVNGTWTLQVTDHFGGAAGTLRGWSLELTSRFD